MNGTVSVVVKLSQGYGAHTATSVILPPPTHIGIIEGVEMKFFKHVLIVGLLLFICLNMTGNAPETAGVSGDITIGLALPLTGIGAVPYGLSMRHGFELAKEAINKAQLLGDASISFSLEDDMSSVEGAVEAYQNLVAQGVPAIVGYAYTFQIDHVFLLANESRVVTFSSVAAGAGRSALSDYTFRAALATDVVNPALVTGAYSILGYTKVATIYDENDAYSVSSHAELSTALAELDVEVVTEQTLQTGETNFSKQLTAIMEANPEAIMISAMATEMVKIMSQGREIGIPDSVRYILPTLNANEVEMIGDAAEGAITATAWFGELETPGNKAFVKSYRAEYGVNPDQWAAQSYAALHILAAAIARAGSTDSTAIRDALASIEGYETILGDFSFNADGDAVYEPTLLIVANGELQLFDGRTKP